jgi:hypothetical protein
MMVGRSKNREDGLAGRSKKFLDGSEWQVAVPAHHGPKVEAVEEGEEGQNDLFLPSLSKNPAAAKISK